MLCCFVLTEVEKGTGLSGCWLLKRCAFEMSPGLAVSSFSYFRGT